MKAASSKAGTFDELVALSGRFAELARAQFMIAEATGGSARRRRIAVDDGSFTLRPCGGRERSERGRHSGRGPVPQKKVV